MITYFPTPAVNESIYGVVTRYADLIPYLGKRRIINGGIRGGSSTNFDFCLPSRINLLTDSLPQHYAVTTRYLIWNHTLFPYYSAFLSADQRHKLYARMSKIKYIRKYSIIIKNLNTINNPRYCEACADHDTDQYGFPYWHREHQIREIIICYHHAKRLIEIDIPKFYGPYISLERAIEDKSRKKTQLGSELVLGIAKREHRV